MQQADRLDSPRSYLVSDEVWERGARRLPAVPRGARDATVGHAWAASTRRPRSWRIPHPRDRAVDDAPCAVGTLHLDPRRGADGMVSNLSRARSHGGHMPGGAYSALSGMQSRLDELDRIAVGPRQYRARPATRRSGRLDVRGRARFRDRAAVGGGRRGRRHEDRSPTGHDHRNGPKSRRGDRRSRASSPSQTRPGHPVHAQRQLHAARRRRADDRRRRAGARRGEPAASSSGTGVLAIDERRHDPHRRHARGQDSARGRSKTRTMVSGDRLEVPRRLGVKPKPSDAVLVPGALEQANVSMVDRMATLTEVTRNFEALQRGGLGADERHRRARDRVIGRR